MPASLLSPKERIEFALENQIHPGVYREEFETGFFVFWHRVQYSPYDWSGYSAAARRAHYPVPLAHDGRIYFAGDGICWGRGWHEGAVQSGWHAIEMLRHRVMANA